MGKVIFSVCPHLLGGGVPHLRSEVGGTPSQVWVGGTPSQVWVGGTPSQVQGYPISGATPCLGGTPSQGGTQCSGGPHVWGVPHVQGVPHVWWGVPHLQPPPHCTEQHSEHLLRGGRCASCVHAGGLSCLFIFL